MQPPIVKDDNLQYIVNDVYKHLNELKTEMKKTSESSARVQGFNVVKYANGDFRIEVTTPEGIAVSSAFSLKEK